MYVNYYKKTQMIDGENEPIGIFIIIDISSSMNQKLAGSTKTKLELAKEGAIESIKTK